METRRVQAGKGTILSAPDRSSAVDAIAELIWNSVDADATTVDVAIALTDLGAPDEITITDDGSGMTYAEATEVFALHGDSWKAATKFSAGGRPHHGRHGRGRFLVYALATSARWDTVAKIGEGLQATTIRGTRAAPDMFEFDGPDAGGDATGTILTMRPRDDQKAARLVDGGVLHQLTARLAPTLLALPALRVMFRGQRVDPAAGIAEQHEVPLNLTPDLLHGHPQPRLKIVEWKENMRSQHLVLCDGDGVVATQHKFERLPPSPVFWTAYLYWEGFGDSSLMGPADLEHPDVQHGAMLAAAHGAVAEFLERRSDERKGQLVAAWKAEHVYPYRGEPQSAPEQVERELFDIVAVIASPSVGKTADQKRLSLRLLSEAVRAEPTRTRKALQAVLSLSDEDAEVLDQLLQRTTLGALVSTARTIADRSDFLAGLEEQLFSDATRRQFREVDQLHPMLVKEPWIFGDEWSMALSESGLSAVVEGAIAKLGKDAVYAPKPTVLPSGKRGRVDLVFDRCLPESEATRHLVVELKRPKKITMTEYGQINNYATAITEHPQVLESRNKWDFWLVCTEMDRSVENQLTDPSRPGLANETDSFRVWIVTWNQLIDAGNRRLAAFREQLDIASSRDAGRAYLDRVHSEYIVQVGGDAIAPDAGASSGEGQAR